MRLKISEETDKGQIKLAEKQGKALSSALKEMTKNVADSGNEVEAGDYLIAYAIEEAESLYKWDDEGLVLIAPGEENKHLEICIRDSATGRFIPYLEVMIVIMDEEGNRIAALDLPFLWHPWIHHYGANLLIPSGEYKLQIMADAPSFSRHDIENGSMFRDPIYAEFDITID